MVLIPVIYTVLRRRSSRKDQVLGRAARVA